MITAWAPHLRSVLRIVVAFLYLVHGSQKLLGIPPSARGGGTVRLASLIGAAGTIELVGGLLILVGLYTRLAAFVC